jgi:hypothetical protein
LDRDRGIQSTLQHLAELRHRYNLTATPIELLTYSHEQFLTSQRGHRKQQGAYYTPPALVDYLVTQTVGPWLQTPANATRPVRLLDPACGAGAFLLRSYGYLLNWYQAQALVDSTNQRSQLYQSHRGEWHLTLAAKWEILSHLYGVDLDQTAVELTKRSLLLQLLSDSAEEAAVCGKLALSNDDLTLDNNIYWGNALVGPDFDPAHDPESLDRQAIQPFDWERTFPQILPDGFDVVLGNPPWVFTRTAQFDDRLKRYYQTTYLSRTKSATGKASQPGKINLCVVFLFKFIQLLHPQGRIGIVLPNTVLRTTIYENLRRYLLQHCHIEQIVDLEYDAFAQVTASTVLLILSKDVAQSTVCYKRSIAADGAVKMLSQTAFANNISAVFNVGFSSLQQQIFDKMTAGSIPLGSITKDIIEGIVCRKDQIVTSPLSDRHQRILAGKDIHRYAIAARTQYILFDRQRLHRPRPDYVWTANEKIILRRIAGGTTALVGVLDTERHYAFASTNNILMTDTWYNIRYLLALLNSQLLNYYYVHRFTNQSKLTVNIAKTFVEQLPLWKLEQTGATDRQQHDRLVQAVDRIQALHRQRCQSNSLDEQTWLQQQIQTVDRQIDRWVYDLYHLTESEIDLIDPSSQPV